MWPIKNASKLFLFSIYFIGNSLFFLLLIIFPNVLRGNNNFFLELGGYAGFASLNYEREFLISEKYKFNTRIGFSMYPNNNNPPNLIFPIGIGCILGHKKHFLEFGIGQTIINASYNNPYREISYSLTGFYGYRFINSSKKLFFKIGYVPIYENYSKLYHWGGVGIGYIFNKLYSE